jgi:hypothetical protein
MRNTRLWVPVVLGLLACSSDQPPAAHVALDKTLPDSPLARMPNVSMLAAGGAFTLAGYQDGQVRWARLSRDGVLADETGFALKAPVLGPYFAATQKAAPADQVVAIVLRSSSTVPDGYDLVAIAQSLGASSAAAPVLLDTLPSETDTTTVQIAAGAALSGNLGVVAWGTQGGPLKFHLLGADAAPTSSAPRIIFSDNPPPWDCLASTIGPTGMGFGVITPDPLHPKFTDWTTLDIDAAGGVSPTTYGFPTELTTCGVVGSPTSTGGYDMAFRNVSGIGVAFYYPPPPDRDTGSVTTHPMAVPAARFGSPDRIPSQVWAAQAGTDITVGLATSSGVQVVRFTYQGAPHGSALALRSAGGRIGKVASWVDPDLTYVTYADLAAGDGGSSNVRRYFAAVEAPEKLP